MIDRAAPIHVQQNNPKSGASAERYAKYRAATTAKEFIDLGGKRADLKNDIVKGYVTVIDATAPAPAPAEPGDAAAADRRNY